MNINAAIILPYVNTISFQSVDSETTTSTSTTQPNIAKEMQVQPLNISSKLPLTNMITSLIEPLENLISLLTSSKSENNLTQLLNIMPKLDQNLSVQLSKFTEKIVEKYSLSTLLDKNIQSKTDALPLKSMDSFLLKEDDSSNSWKMILFPILDDQKIIPLKFYYRHPEDDVKEETTENNEFTEKENKKRQTRFVAEFNLSNIGLIQFDGLIDSKTFHLYVRSQINFPESIQKDIESLFKSILDTSTKNGNLIFETHTQLPQIAIIEDKNDQRPLFI